MSSKEAKQFAERYLKEQAQIIAKYGQTPRLNGDRYKEALADTRKTFETLSAGRIIK